MSLPDGRQAVTRCQKLCNLKFDLYLTFDIWNLKFIVSYFMPQGYPFRVSDSRISGIDWKLEIFVTLSLSPLPILAIFLQSSHSPYPLDKRR